MKNQGKLDQLTALRFFAALMIVIHHSAGLFGIRRTGIDWGQGVSFFFVLSGFILTYVYPSLETLPEVKRFWRARIARIWPAYAASFALGFVLIPYTWDTRTAVANLLMVQGWLPLSTYYFSYNAVSWSVSTEAFFYLVFPLLLYQWDRTWKVKLVLTGATLIALLAVTNSLQLPSYGNPAVGSDGLMVTQHGLVYINPIARLFEFVLGMAVAVLWRRREWSIRSAWASAWELGAIVLCVLSMFFSKDVAQWARASNLGGPAALWISHSGSLVAFGLLIYVFAHGRGSVSRVLSRPALVLLGEVSLSVYLIHQILLTVYSRNAPALAQVPNPIAFLVYFLILILSSYLMWACIEMPGRRLLLGRATIHGTSTMRKSWRDHLPTGRRPLVAGLVLLCLVGIVRLSAKDAAGPPRIDGQAAERMTPDGIKPALGAGFHDFLKLRGLDVECKGSDLAIRIAWEKTGSTSARLANAVHLINAAGDILGQGDYRQPEAVASMKPGDIWLDSVAIPRDRIKDGVTGLAIGVYDQSGNLFPVHHRSTDWGGRRLVIAIDYCK